MLSFISCFGFVCFYRFHSGVLDLCASASGQLSLSFLFFSSNFPHFALFAPLSFHRQVSVCSLSPSARTIDGAPQKKFRSGKIRARLVSFRLSRQFLPPLNWVSSPYPFLLSSIPSAVLVSFFFFLFRCPHFIFFFSFFPRFGVAFQYFLPSLSFITTLDGFGFVPLRIRREERKKTPRTYPSRPFWRKEGRKTKGNGEEKKNRRIFCLWIPPLSSKI